MNILQYFLAYGIMQICFHKLEYQIQILIVLCFYYVMQFDDIIVIELVQKHDFTIGSLSISRVLKSIEYFFKCQSLTVLFVCDFPDMSIGPTTNFF